ncbi:hypothetical protein [Corynebacterium mastitidis]|uniref:hypothetical protein n=1 Tax=Corynebacterium mastitidis TaxID=161890 RepID=UPI00254F8E39|nr:hypothetical protein [Corynebacterium mastitidis]MDK8451061.1 hypothetical protein [Corynebacterium mastitidis]
MRLRTCAGLCPMRGARASTIWPNSASSESGIWLSQKASSSQFIRTRRRATASSPHAHR